MEVKQGQSFDWQPSKSVTYLCTNIANLPSKVAPQFPVCSYRTTSKDSCVGKTRPRTSDIPMLEFYQNPIQ